MIDPKTVNEQFRSSFPTLPEFTNSTPVTALIPASLFIYVFSAFLNIDIPVPSVLITFTLPSRKTLPSLFITVFSLLSVIFEAVFELFVKKIIAQEPGIDSLNPVIS